jgi:hypothetical protein
MEWNEFNRELQNRVSDPGLRYMLGMVYERLLDLSKQQDHTSELMLMLTGTIKEFVTLNDAMDNKVKELNKIVKGEHDGVTLRSVPLTND